MTQDAFSGQAGILLPDGEHVLYHFWETLASVMSSWIVRRILPRIVCVLALVLLAAASSPATASAATYYGWFDYARNGSNTNGLLAWGYVANDMPPIHATPRHTA